jgi:mRNA (guanine-N7-)-methyltransferase
MALKKGGFFIVTTPDAYVLVKKLRESSKLKFGNQIYQCSFETKDFQKEKGFFGLKYEFELTDAIGMLYFYLKIDKCPEYLVHPDVLESLAKGYGLNLVEQSNFHEFYERNVDDFDNLNQIYKIKSGMSKEEWDAIYLYKGLYFCFFQFFSLSLYFPKGRRKEVKSICTTKKFLSKIG